MFLSLWVDGFRNLSDCRLDLKGRGPFLIIGRNNQGKTNFLESLYFLLNGQSFQTSTVSAMLGFSKEAAFVGGDIQGADAVHRVYAKIDAFGKRSASLDGEMLRSYLGLKKLCRVQYLSADVLHVLQRSADYRRRFLDGFASIYFSEYAGTLKRYSRALKQKNQLLKSGGDLGALSVFNAQLVADGTKLVAWRWDLLAQLTAALRSFSGQLLEDILPKVFLQYKVSGFDGDVSAYEGFLADRFRDNVEKERRVGYSLYGPHRDDFDVLVSDLAVQSFFSRGINRVVSILLMLSEQRLLADKLGMFPVLLLDDTFAELDFEMKQRLMQVMCETSQVFYASVMDEDRQLLDNWDVLEVSKGQVYHAAFV